MYFDDSAIQRLFNSVKRALKPGGIFIADTPGWNIAGRQNVLAGGGEVTPNFLNLGLISIPRWCLSSTVRLISTFGKAFRASWLASTPAPPWPRFLSRPSEGNPSSKNREGDAHAS
jgi:SAM-dependent methyltransferase